MYGYFTADRVGISTGGGIVTKNELEALASLGQTILWNPESKNDPFYTEKSIVHNKIPDLKLAHFYSGTFPDTVKYLKSKGTKISYTAAAHDIDLSRAEFEKLNIPYDLPHITNPELWEKYLQCYLMADVVICPSTHSKEVMERFGCKNVKVVPHGCHIMKAKPYPKTFTIGYLGQTGPDKGLIYLIEAWSKLNYKDAIFNIAGSQSMTLLPWIRHFKYGNYNIMGYVKNIEDFYNSISIYVQPSVTEGFGIEVLESMATGRPVVASDGAGAADCIGSCGLITPKKDVVALMQAIDTLKNNKVDKIQPCQLQADKYTWDKIKQQYTNVWKELLV
jgi:glycosyltransferase involved in cell wall biosynthesis